MDKVISRGKIDITSISIYISLIQKWFVVLDVFVFLETVDWILLVVVVVVVIHTLIHT